MLDTCEHDDGIFVFEYKKGRVCEVCESQERVVDLEGKIEELEDKLETALKELADQS